MTSKFLSLNVALHDPQLFTIHSAECHVICIIWRKEHCTIYNTVISLVDCFCKTIFPYFCAVWKMKLTVTTTIAETKILFTLYCYKFRSQKSLVNSEDGQFELRPTFSVSIEHILDEMMRKEKRSFNQLKLSLKPWRCFFTIISGQWCAYY